MHTTTSTIALLVAVFLGSAVEGVEALTIIVAAGVTRGWRSALEGMALALGVLVVLVGALGPALVRFVPLDVLRAVVGVLLLNFGLQWLRKAVLRAVGLKAKHDEDLIYKKQVAALSEGATAAERRRAERDPAGFVVSFKGTFLEGLEVAIIVIGLGGGDHQLGLASAAAAGAIVVVAGVGVVVAHHLAGVPENAMKTVVGLMLVSFGTFWTGEGLKVRWPGDDLAILYLVGLYALATWLLVQAIKASGGARQREAAGA
jgi:uncharacterized membrane protein